MRQEAHEQSEPNGKFVNQPLYLQVAGSMAERIAKGEWPKNTNLPSEADLARECGISQGTMRKALDLLEARHIVKRQQGRGTFVQDLAAINDDRARACYVQAQLLVEQAVIDAKFTRDTASLDLLTLLTMRIARSLVDAGKDYSQSLPPSAIDDVPEDLVAELKAP